jgi:hypothetical protein
MIYPTIADLLVANNPREMPLAMEELLEAGARRAYAVAKETGDGHKANVVGQMRHFKMNEAFAAGLNGLGAQPNAIRGNNLIVGTSGMFRLGRFNISEGPWYHASKSVQRRTLAEANLHLEPLVMGDLYRTAEQATTGAAFFVCVFSSSFARGEVPLSIEIAVPDSSMKGWLFREPIPLFVMRYNQAPSQVDKATPTLKAQGRQTGDPDLWEA